MKHTWKKLSAWLLTAVMLLTMMPAMVIPASAAENVTVYVKSPSGQSTELSLPSNTTIAEVKQKIAQAFSISFESTYRIYCSEVGFPNYELEDETKTLAEYSFQSGYTIHVEKDIWTATSDHPIEIFGLTITGGTGAQEPYGAYSSADYYWNYYYKTIIIRSTAKITISGTGEMNTNIIIKKAGSGKYTNLTISDLHLVNDDGACIDVQGNSWVKLTVKGTNTLTSTGENAPYTVDKVPALTLTNSGAYLKIMKASTGTLTATTNIAGQPGIGTYDNTSTTWGLEINGGTIIANGGSGSAGIRADAVCIYGGNVTANGGIDVYGSGNSVYPNPFEIIGGTVVASSDTQALSIVPVLTEYTNYTAIASANKDGTGASTYDSAANDTYKYFKIEPRTVFSITTDSNIKNGTVKTDKASAGKNEVVTLTVNPDSGYSLESLKYNNGKKDIEITGTSFTMPAADVVITATFKPNPYTITFDANGGSTVVPITLNYGTAITAPAAPVWEGHTFSGWSPALPATMPAENLTVEAIWDVNTYKLSWVVDGVAQTSNVAYGAAITAPANPAKKNYTFAGWDAEIPATMPARDLTFTAVWAAIPENTVAPAAGGTVVVDTLTPTTGDTVTITPVAESGMQIDTVAVFDAAGAPVAVVDNGDGTFSYVQPVGVVTINVTFEAIPRETASLWLPVLARLYMTSNPITAIAGEGGVISDPGVTEVKYGRNHSYVITPDEGYIIADVLVNGKSVGAVSEYTFKKVRRAQVIEVVFAPVAVEEAPVEDSADPMYSYEDIT